MLSELIRKLDCEACRLRTEHYVLLQNGNQVLVSRCLRCGRAAETEMAGHDAYPVDDRRPVYVL